MRGVTPDAILDLNLLKLPTFFAGVVGGFLFRFGHRGDPVPHAAIAADRFRPFAVRIRLADFRCGGGGDGDEVFRLRLIKRFGFRTILVANALISAVFLASYGLVGAHTPHALIFFGLLIGGFFRSLEFTALNAIGYADVPSARMSRATSFASVSQQMSRRSASRSRPPRCKACNGFSATRRLRRATCS